MNQEMISPNGKFYAILLPNGDFVVRRRNIEDKSFINSINLWSTNTAPKDPATHTDLAARVVVQWDCNLVLQGSDSKATFWLSKTFRGCGKSEVVMQNDGNLFMLWTG